MKINILKIKKFSKVRKHCHYTSEYRCTGHNMSNFIVFIVYSLPKEIVIVFHNGSNNDYHFNINGLAQEFKEQFTCLGDNTKKYINFTVPIEKEELIKMEKKAQKKYLTY